MNEFEQLRAALAGRYDLQRELGRGGMATVYLAEDLKHGREVAVKVLRREVAAELGAERFLREIELAARLRHPHILPLYDSGPVDAPTVRGSAEPVAGVEGEATDRQPVGPSARLFYVMPYVQGESLRDRLNRERQLPLADALAITREVADALAFAHSRGVVHRDIKPENILLEAGHAVVSDFGIARAISEAGSERLTATGLAVGTPAYMSPEQAMGDRELDGRTDIYALGCVAYEMLVGEAPLVGATVQATMGRRMTETPPSIRTVREVIPASVDRTIRQALARVPADRPATMQQFAQALETPGSLPAEDAAPDVSGRRVRWRRPGRVAAVLSLVLAAVATVLLWPRPPRNLDADLLAVAPFDVLAPELAMWSEGMVDVLSSKLDGVGPLRTAPPSAVIRRWRGRADRGSATALARSLGAGLVVFGRLLPAGPDTVRASLTIFDLQADRSLADLDIRAGSGRPDRLADSLALHLLAELTRARTIGVARLNSLGSTSPEAVKAFLQGEQYYRRMALDSARPRYERAIALDSTFALAYNRLATVEWWTPPFEDWKANALRAGALNHGLAARESLAVAIDAGLAARFIGDSASWAVLHRLPLTAEEAVQRYPEDATLQFRLGEVRVHLGAYLGETAERALLPFRRAVALDSSFMPAYLHLIELEYILNGAAAGQRATRAALSHNPDFIAAPGLEVLGVMLDPARRARGGATVLDTTGVGLLALSLYVIMRMPGTDTVTSQGLAALHRKVESAGQPPRWAQVARVAAWRGRFAEAHESLARTGGLGLDGSQVDVAELFSELALLDALPAAEVDSAYRGWLRRPDLLPLHDPFLQDGGTNGVYLALPWWFHRGDTVALARAGLHARRAARVVSIEDRAFAERTGRLADVYLRLARGDSARALRELETLPNWPCAPCYHDRLLRARLLAAFHRDAEAARILDQMPTSGGPPLPGQLLWYLERGRAHERLGHAQQARDAYAYVADIWRTGDPATRPAVEEAQAALERLGRRE